MGKAQQFKGDNHGYSGFRQGELIEVVEWLEDSGDVSGLALSRQGSRDHDGRETDCREGQAAVFVNEGQIADVYKPASTPSQLRTCLC